MGLSVWQHAHQGYVYSWFSCWKCTRLLEIHELAESNGKGHAWAPSLAGCLTQHNPGVIKHDKKKKGKGLVVTSVHSAQAPRDQSIQKYQLFSILLEPKFGSPTAISTHFSQAFGVWSSRPVASSIPERWLGERFLIPVSSLLSPHVVSGAVCKRRDHISTFKLPTCCLRSCTG